jgi:tetratricopeptide (TPR) repeat protein
MDKELNDAIRMLKKVLQKQPDDLEIHERLLKALVTAGFFTEIPEYFISMVRVKPLWTQFHYEIVGMMNMVSSSAGGQAIRHEFQVNTEKNPKEVFYWYGLGLINQTLSDQPAAATAYLAAIKADPSYAPAYHNLGVALRLCGEWSEALACHEIAVKISSNLAEAHYALGVMYMRQSQYVEARSHFTEFVRLAPPYLDTYVQEAEISIAALSKVPRL